MQDRKAIYCPGYMTAALLQAQTRYELCKARAHQVLRDPPPDTFLGHKHYEPIPLPEETVLETRISSK